MAEGDEIVRMGDAKREGGIVGCGMDDRILVEDTLMRTE
jgi:hypothetical protein